MLDEQGNRIADLVLAIDVDSGLGESQSSATMQVPLSRPVVLDDTVDYVGEADDEADGASGIGNGNSNHYLDASLSSAMSFKDHFAAVNIYVADPVDTPIPRDSDDDVIIVNEEPADPNGVQRDEASSSEDFAPPPRPTCSVCKTRCTCRATYEIHEKFCRGKSKKYPCRFPQCAQHFRTRSLARLHFNAAHDDERVVCGTDGCQMTFRRMNARQEHIRRVHLGVMLFLLVVQYQSTGKSKCILDLKSPNYKFLGKISVRSITSSVVGKISVP